MFLDFSLPLSQLTFRVELIPADAIFPLLDLQGNSRVVSNIATLWYEGKWWVFRQIS